MSKVLRRSSAIILHPKLSVKIDHCAQLIYRARASLVYAILLDRFADSGKLATLFVPTLVSLGAFRRAHSSGGGTTSALWEMISISGIELNGLR